MTRFRSRKVSRPASRPRPHRPRLELLEERCVLAATSLAPQLLLNTTAGVQTVKLDPGSNVSAMLADYQGRAGVLSAEVDQVVSADVLPNDPSFGTQFDMNNTGQSSGKPDADIDAPEAWDLHTGSTRVTVGVIDTGIDYRHPDLYLNVWLNQGELPSGLNDSDGDGRVTFYDLNNSANSGYTSAAVSALNYANAMGIQITNNSWGGGGYSSAMDTAIANARAKGFIFVAAAGNNGTNNDSLANYPSNYSGDNVVAVAATDRNDNLASYSDYGATTVDLAAPGSSILSTTPNNTYSTFSGTSMATPHVAGAAALLWSYNGSLTYNQVISRLLNNVDPLSNLTGKVASGGRLNLYKALSAGTA